MTTIDDSKPVLLRPTGGTPLSFTGTLGAIAHTKDRENRDRWHQVNLWRVAGTTAKYVISIEYVSSREGELGLVDVLEAEGGLAMAHALSSFVDSDRPLAGVIAIPVGSPKYDHVVRDLRLRLRHAASNVMKALPGAVRNL